MGAPAAGSRSALSGGLHGATCDADRMGNADRHGGCGDGDRQHQRHRGDELGHHPAAASAHAGMVARRKAGLVDGVGRHGLSLSNHHSDSLAYENPQIYRRRSGRTWAKPLKIGGNFEAPVNETLTRSGPRRKTPHSTIAMEAGSQFDRTCPGWPATRWSQARIDGNPVRSNWLSCAIWV